MKTLNELPNEIYTVFDRYHQKGKQIYLVGGSLRDLLSDIKATDYDFATDALPEESKEIFSDCKIIDIGKKYGTLKIIKDSFSFEVTPFRKEWDYDHRRPGKIAFRNSLKEDLERRDFTLNALAWNPKVGLVDYFKGQEDLENKIIRAIGNPTQRFEEDALRILRALRFTCKKDYGLEEGTKKAIINAVKDLDYISRERILEEFHKILLGPDPRKGLCLLDETGILDYLFPESKKDKILPLIYTKKLTPAVSQLLFSLYDEPLDQARNFLKKYPYSNQEKKEISFLLNYGKREIPLDSFSLRSLMAQHSPESFKDLLDLKSHLGQDVEALKKKTNDLLNQEIYLSKKDLALDGKDLIALGFEEGPLLGKILEDLFLVILREPSFNRKALLKALLATRKVVGFW